MEQNERKEELTGKSHLVRLYEANAGIQFPTDNDLRFRDAVANKLTQSMGLPVSREVPKRTQPPARS
jgi:hypothetical protein